MKWGQIALFLCVGLGITWSAWDVLRTAMDLWSGLPDPEYRTARVVSLVRIVLQVSAVLLCLLPLALYKPARRDVATSVTALVVFSTVLLFVVLFAAFLSDYVFRGKWGRGNSFERVCKVQVWILIACVGIGFVWWVGRLFTILRRTGGVLLWGIGLLVAVHVVGITGFLLAVRGALNSRTVMWTIPVVKRVQSIQLPQYRLCRHCGETNVLGTTYDDEDYDLLSTVVDEEDPCVEFVYWNAPYSPGLGHMDKWNQVTFDSLHLAMRRLRKDTYESFIKRNESVAVHDRQEFLSRNRRRIRIAGEGSRNVRAVLFTRAGFSADGRQALILRRDWGYEKYVLWEKDAGRWNPIGAKVSQHWWCCY